MESLFERDNEERIINEFGNEFYIRTKELLKLNASKWEVNDLKFINSYSTSLIFKGVSRAYGPVIMKFSRDSHEFKNEVQALKSFDGDVISKLYEVDLDNLVLLEEAIEPGTVLEQEKNLNTRLNEFCKLLGQMHFSEGYSKPHDTLESDCHDKSYKDWVFNITDFMEKQKEWHDVTAHMKRAKDYFIELSEAFPSEKLLHGDFHYYNILQTDTGYKVIDPKGVRGNWIFDIPRYVLNEFWDEADDLRVDDTINKVITFLSNNLKLDAQILYKLLYIEGTMAMCWNIESGSDITEKEDILETIEWLEKYLNSDDMNID